MLPHSTRAGRAPERSRCNTDFHHGLLGACTDRSRFAVRSGHARGRRPGGAAPAIACNQGWSKVGNSGAGCAETAPRSSDRCRHGSPWPRNEGLFRAQREATDFGMVLLRHQLPTVRQRRVCSTSTAAMRSACAIRLPMGWPARPRPGATPPRN